MPVRRGLVYWVAPARSRRVQECLELGEDREAGRLGDDRGWIGHLPDDRRIISAERVQLKDCSATPSTRALHASTLLKPARPSTRNLQSRGVGLLQAIAPLMYNDHGRSLRPEAADLGNGPASWARACQSRAQVRLML